MTAEVFLLSPSHGLGGGIERFVTTIETAFAQENVSCRRFDLRTPSQPHGLRAKARFVRTTLVALGEAPGEVRLVLAHRNLLPIVRLALRYPTFGGATVILHGSEIWTRKRLSEGSLLRHPQVRVVAVSNFSAGAVASICQATVLPPGLTAAWYETLTATAGTRRTGFRIMTAFRLGDWKDKGLPALLEAIDLIGDDRIELTVCGSGPVPQTLASLHPRCRVRADLSDADLAAELASSDVFVLSTRTRPGAGSCGEGFGLVLLEAQLTGTPVIAPAYGGSGDAFQAGTTGLSPVDESPRALAQVIQALLDDPPRREEMGRSAAAWSRAQFEPVTYASRAVRALC